MATLSAPALLAWKPFITAVGGIQPGGTPAKAADGDWGGGRAPPTRQLSRRLSKKQSMRREASRSVQMRNGEVVTPSSVLSFLRDLYGWIHELFCALDTSQDGRIDVAEAGAMVQRALTSEGLNIGAKVNLTGTFETTVDPEGFVGVFLSWLGTDDTLAEGLKDAGVFVYFRKMLSCSLASARSTLPEGCTGLECHCLLCRGHFWNSRCAQWVGR